MGTHGKWIEFAGLALSKGLLGYLVGSTALIADAVNNVGDLLCDAVVFYTVTEARKASTPDQPWYFQPLFLIISKLYNLSSGTFPPSIHPIFIGGAGSWSQWVILEKSINTMLLFLDEFCGVT